MCMNYLHPWTLTGVTKADNTGGFGQQNTLATKAYKAGGFWSTKHTSKKVDTMPFF